MRCHILGAGISAALLAGASAQADDSELAVKAFHEICLDGGPDYDLTAARARRLAWPPLPASAVSTFGPVGDVRAFQGWRAGGSDVPAQTLVGVTKAVSDGKPVQTCTLAMFDGDYRTFEKRFFTKTDAEKIDEQRDGRQVSRVYFMIAGDRKQIVRLTFPAAAGTRNMLTASSIALELRPERHRRRND